METETDVFELALHILEHADMSFGPATAETVFSEPLQPLITDESAGTSWGSYFEEHHYWSTAECWKDLDSEPEHWLLPPLPPHNFVAEVCDQEHFLETEEDVIELALHILKHAYMSFGPATAETVFGSRLDPLDI